MEDNIEQLNLQEILSFIGLELLELCNIRVNYVCMNQY